MLQGDERVNSVEAQLSSGYPGQVYGSYQDHRVPFPRTSGARFCSAGLCPFASLAFKPVVFFIVLPCVSCLLVLG